MIERPPPEVLGPAMDLLKEQGFEEVADYVRALESLVRLAEEDLGRSPMVRWSAILSAELEMLLSEEMERAFPGLPWLSRIGYDFNTWRIDVDLGGGPSRQYRARRYVSPDEVVRGDRRRLIRDAVESIRAEWEVRSQGGSTSDSPGRTRSLEDARPRAQRGGESPGGGRGQQEVSINPRPAP
jgi:hypothetical protein